MKLKVSTILILCLILWTATEIVAQTAKCDYHFGSLNDSSNSYYGCHLDTSHTEFDKKNHKN